MMIPKGLDNKLNTHQRHLQFLAIEIYKSKNKLNPSFISKTYKEENIPYLRKRGYFSLNPKRKLSETWNKFIK